MHMTLTPSTSPLFSPSTLPEAGSSVPGSWAEQHTEEIPTVNVEQEPPQNDRLWRVIGTLVMLGAAFAFGWHLQQGVVAETVEAPVAPARTAATTTISVDGFDSTASMTLGPVGAAGGERIELDETASAEVTVPNRMRSVVGLFDAAGALRGLTLVGATDDSPIDGSTITPRSTALTLLALMPGVASENFGVVDARLNQLRQVEGFPELERQILKSDGILGADQELEVALARVLDDLPPPTAVPEPCPSDANPDAVRLGVCVRNDDGALSVENRTQRWIALFAPSDEVRSCGAVPPGQSASTITFPSCAQSVDLAGPGQLGIGQSDAQREYVALAGALTVLNEYVIATNNTLTGSDPRVTDNRERLLGADNDVIGLQLRAWLSANEGLGQNAGIVGDPSRPAAERLEAWTVLGQAMLDSVITGPPASGYVDRPAAPGELSRFFELARRTAQWLGDDATIASWDEPSTLRVGGGDQ